MNNNITRRQIIDALINKLKPLNYVFAAWEAGAASFNRVDQWSDIDLNIIVEDERVEDAFGSIDEAIAGLSEVELKYRLPEPTWHGHSQLFLRLKQASPFLFLDIVVLKRSSKDKFLQYKIHGKPLIHFDKVGIVKDDPIDPDAFLKMLASRIETLKVNFELFQVLILKELNRGNYLTAFGFYFGYTLRPLVEILRIRYCPFHYNFFASYVNYDLPADVVEKLQRLFFVPNTGELGKRRAEAEGWFHDVSRNINLDDVKKKLTEKPGLSPGDAVASG